LPSSVGAGSPHDSRRDGGATFVIAVRIAKYEAVNSLPATNDQ